MKYLKYFVIVLLSLCNNHSKAQVAVIDTSFDYKETVLKQFKKTIYNWKNIIDNIELLNIYYGREFCIADSNILKFVTDNIISFTSLCSYYNVNEKIVRINSLKEAFSLSDENTKNEQYLKYIEFVTKTIKLNHFSMLVSFELFEKKTKRKFCVNEYLVYSSNGIVFDNILYFINPMTFK